MTGKLLLLVLFANGKRIKAKITFNKRRSNRKKEIL